MILDDIVAIRKKQLEREKFLRDFESIKHQAESMTKETRGFAAALKKNGISVIAEVKKASPSKGVIQPDFDPIFTAKAYEAAGADAISVLTEEHYFQGNSKYLRQIRNMVSLPILRKDFIIDPYQIYEARVIGADAVLLIAALLDSGKLSEYQKIANSLGLDALVEVHDLPELESALKAGSKIIGINNRDLRTFDVDLNTTAELAKLVPEGKIVVSESGIKDHADMKYLSRHRADAVLIGETLMRSENISDALTCLREGL